MRKAFVFILALFVPPKWVEIHHVDYKRSIELDYIYSIKNKKGIVWFNGYTDVKFSIPENKVQAIKVENGKKHRQRKKPDKEMQENIRKILQTKTTN